MGNQKLISYETIVQATEGETEAVDEVLQYYSQRIQEMGKYLRVSQTVKEMF